MRSKGGFAAGHTLASDFGLGQGCPARLLASLLAPSTDQGCAGERLAAGSLCPGMRRVLGGAGLWLTKEARSVIHQVLPTRLAEGLGILVACSGPRREEGCAADERR